MSIISRSVYNRALKLNNGFNPIFRFKRSTQSTSTDSTPETMELDSESQEEDQG